MAWLKQILKHASLRGVSALMALLFALPLGWKGLTGFYNWLSPFIMLNSIAVLNSVVLLNLAGFIVLVFVIIRKRWFCHKLCPVGLACDWVSSLNQNKRSIVKSFPPIGKWLAIVSLAGAVVGFPVFAFWDPMSIFNGFFGAFAQTTSIIVIISFAGLPGLLIINLFLPGVWCSKLCPLGGFQDEIYQIRKHLVKKKNGETNVAVTPFGGRRLFLFTGVGLVSGLVVPKILKGGTSSYFRPPGAVDKQLFNFLCIRCGSCIKACPSKIIVHRKDSADVVSWMIPEISFRNGYCIEDCNLCSQVCPSGAITLFDAAAKNILKIGQADVLPQDCLLTKNKECDRCKMACKYDAIKIDVYGQYDALPTVDHDKCNGCGACFVICPTETIKMNHI